MDYVVANSASEDDPVADDHVDWLIVEAARRPARAEEGAHRDRVEVPVSWTRYAT